jgi:hypothetical protein
LSFLSRKHSVSTDTIPLLASSGVMYVACLSSSPMTEVKRTRSAGALDALSMRTNRVISELLISTFAEAVSQHRVSK